MLYRYLDGDISGGRNEKGERGRLIEIDKFAIRFIRRSRDALFLIRVSISWTTVAYGRGEFCNGTDNLLFKVRTKPGPR